MSRMDKKEEDLWVDRATRYFLATELSLDPLWGKLPPPVFAKLYEEGWEEWRKEQMADSSLTFTLGDRQAQEVFYHNIDAICATLDSVKKDDWKVCVPLDELQSVSVFDHPSGSFELTLLPRAALGMSQ